MVIVVTCVADVLPAHIVPRNPRTSSTTWNGCSNVKLISKCANTTIFKITYGIVRLSKIHTSGTALYTCMHMLVSCFDWKLTEGRASHNPVQVVRETAVLVHLTHCCCCFLLHHWLHLNICGDVPWQVSAIIRSELSQASPVQLLCNKSYKVCLVEYTTNNFLLSCVPANLICTTIHRFSHATLTKPILLQIAFKARPKCMNRNAWLSLHQTLLASIPLHCPD